MNHDPDPRFTLINTLAIELVADGLLELRRSINNNLLDYQFGHPDWKERLDMIDTMISVARVKSQGPVKPVPKTGSRPEDDR